MNRRNFLSLFVSATAAAGLGISPAFAEPQGDYSIRYLQCFDIRTNSLMHRIDVTKGSQFALSVPKQIENGQAFHGVTKAQISSILRTMTKEEGAIAALLSSLPRDGEMRGVNWSAD